MSTRDSCPSQDQSAIVAVHHNPVRPTTSFTRVARTSVVASSSDHSGLPVLSGRQNARSVEAEVLLIGNAIYLLTVLKTAPYVALGSTSTETVLEGNIAGTAIVRERHHMGKRAAGGTVRHAGIRPPVQHLEGRAEDWSVVIEYHTESVAGTAILCLVSRAGHVAVTCRSGGCRGRYRRSTPALICILCSGV